MAAAATAPKNVRRAQAGTARTTVPLQLIPAAVGRTADTVRHIPDSGLVTGLVRGRAWIIVLGVLLAGIVAINVVSLSLSSSAGKMEQRATVLEQENSALRASLAQRLSTDRVEVAAAGLGMVRPATDDYIYRTAGDAKAGDAVDRLKAAQ